MKAVLPVLIALGSISGLQAEIIGGIEFPNGVISFADAVVSYSPAIVNGEPTLPFRGAANALGAPSSVWDCSIQATCGFVSLGNGGNIVLRFTDNLLTGSNSSALDLWVFEIGSGVEDTFVDISEDGTTWYSVGKVLGATAGVDIDAFGFGSNRSFSYIRLTDDLAENFFPGETAGADINAVGAISTVAATPEPGTMRLLFVAIATTLMARKIRLVKS